jgi:site-specific DNA recombinase
MKIAALYARVSSAKQQLNENIASQVAAIEEYARQDDYQISPQHVYKDDGLSGARLDRPALDRLRDAPGAGRSRSRVDSFAGSPRPTIRISVYCRRRV